MMRFVLLLIIMSSLVVKAPGQATTKPVPDTAQIKKAITGFYTWYNKYWQKVDAFALYKGKRVKYQPPYVIDWKEVDRYFAYLKKAAPQLHPSFYTTEREWFKQLQKGFDQNPKEEIAIGFDYDRFTNSQDEPQWFMNALKKVRWDFQMLSKSLAAVTLWGAASDERGEYEYQLMCFQLKKDKYGWRISRMDACEDRAE